MKRTVIEIDEEKCNGCGQCVDACHEGAIRMVDGKAKLVSDVYCDGLGDCIGECPVGAITKIEREAEPYDQAAVHAHLAATGEALEAAQPSPPTGGCPGAAVRQFGGPPTGCPGAATRQLQPADEPATATADAPRLSRLRQWPVQLRLVPPNAPFLEGAHLLVCADCVPCAVPDFHERYLSDHVVVMACPKFDPSEENGARLAALMAHGGVASVTVLRMEVPCCGALARQAVEAWKAHATNIPCEVHTIGIEGGIERQTMVAV